VSPMPPVCSLSTKGILETGSNFQSKSYADAEAAFSDCAAALFRSTSTMQRPDFNAGPLSGVLHGLSCQRHAARDGVPDFGQKDCHHRIDRMEERSVLRPPTSETTNSLSVLDRVRSILGIFSSGGRGVLETLWFESESQLVS